jgi:glutathione S-transferase
MAMIKLSAFRWVPPFPQGLVRDLRVRWALEEAGIPYQEMLIGPEDQASAAYRAPATFWPGPSHRDGRAQAVPVGCHRALHRRKVRGAGARGRER